MYWGGYEYYNSKPNPICIYPVFTNFTNSMFDFCAFLLKSMILRHFEALLHEQTFEFCAVDLFLFQKELRAFMQHRFILKN